MGKKVNMAASEEQERRKAKKRKKLEEKVQEEEEPQEEAEEEEDDDHEEEAGEGREAQSASAEGEDRDGGDTKKKRKRKRKHKSRKKGEEDGEEKPQEGGAEDEEEADQQPSSQPGLAPKTVYVEGISYDATEDNLKAFFTDKGCGKVTSIRMPRYHDSNRPRGYAHLDFEKERGVTRALELDGQLMMGRYLKVEQAKDPSAASVTKKPPGCRTLFVKNLPYDVSEDEVKKVFAVCGKIADIRLAIWNNTKALKGFGYVDFVNEASAEIAMKKHGQLKVKDRVVHMDYEIGRPKLSFRTTDGKSWAKLNKKKGSKAR